MVALVPQSGGSCPLVESNQNHEPAGSAKGGQFARKSAGSPAFVELYHGTSVQRANKIAAQGLRIGVHKPTMAGDPESSRNYVWLAKRKEDAQRYADMHRSPAVLTLRIPQHVLDRVNPYGRNSGPDSVWIPENVPAKYVHAVGDRKLRP